MNKHFSRLKLTRAEQSCAMRHDLSSAARLREEQDFLWDLMMTVLEREKETHGPTMMQVIQ